MFPAARLKAYQLMPHPVGSSRSHLGINSSTNADFHVFESLSGLEILVLGKKLSQVGSHLELVRITMLVLASRPARNRVNVCHTDLVDDSVEVC